MMIIESLGMRRRGRMLHVLVPWSLALAFLGGFYTRLPQKMSHQVLQSCFSEVDTCGFALWMIVRVKPYLLSREIL